MHPKRYFISVLNLVFLILPYIANSQISYGGTPASQSYVTDSEFHIHTIVNTKTLKQKSGNNADEIEKNTSLKFADVFEINMNSDEHGTWSELDNGKRIWRLGLKSEGAYSLNFTFVNTEIPDGAEVFVYNSDRSEVIGAFTSENISASGTLPVMPVSGDEIIIEYNEPAGAEFSGFLKVGTVGHDYLGIFGDKDGQFGVSGDCNVDINCTSGLNYYNEKRAICRIVINNSEVCTGVLMNNILYDSTPYILTANHCISSQAMANNTVFVFNYESYLCNGRDGSVKQSMAGCELKATKNIDAGKYLDFSLVKLNTRVPADYFPLFLGWDISDKIPQTTTAIHHPWGDVKKISIDYDSPVRNSFYIGYDHDPGVFWEVKSWDEGTTESGSSGCPLLNDDKLVIGSLVGGYAKCTHDAQDYFLMLSVAFDRYLPSEEQLKAWLDPFATGVKRLSSFDPLGGIVPHIGMEENALIEPNPATDMFKVIVRSNSFFNTDMVVYDINGKQLMRQTISSYVTSVDISDWKEGVYLVRVAGNVMKILVI